MKTILYFLFAGAGILLCNAQVLAQSTEIVTTHYADKVRKTDRQEIGYFLFEGESTRLLEESIPNLKKLRKLLKKHNRMIIELAGHTNGGGINCKRREELSRQRAEVIKNYLVDHGIKSHRVQVKGYGSESPLYRRPKNEDEEKLNRRVEVRILSY
ncbi:MAG: OmpA family protein [Bacteroidia bacterium]|nr:OmpA family protein [Bacteroidia bacterium]